MASSDSQIDKAQRGRPKSWFSLATEAEAEENLTHK